MSSLYKQQKLSFATDGRPVVDGEAASSRSPSPDLASKRRATQPIWHAFVDTKKQRKGQDGARSDGEDVSGEETDPSFEAGGGGFLDDEASETSDEGSDVSGGGKRRRKRYSDEETEEDEVAVVESSSRRNGSKKGKDKAIVLDRSEDEESEGEGLAPLASTTTTKSTSSFPKPPSTTSTTSTTAPQRKKRSASVFEGVIIERSPKKKLTKKTSSTLSTAPSAVSRLKGSVNLFKDGSPAPIKEEKASRTLDLAKSSSEDDSDAPVWPSQRKEPQSKKAAKEKAAKEKAAKGKKRSHSQRTLTPSSDSDSLPVPESLKKQLQKRKRQKKEVDRRKKLATLTQSTQDRRSADEGSSDSAYVVDDDAPLRYDTDVEDEMHGLDSKGKKRRRKELEKKALEKGKGKQREVVVSSSSGEESDQPKNMQKKAGKGTVRDSADEEEEEEVRPAKKDKGKGKKKSKEEVQAELLATDESEDADSEEVGRRRKKGGKKQLKKKTKRRQRSDEEPDDLEILDEQTVIEDRFRTLKDKSSRFAALKASREQRVAAANKSKRIGLDSGDEVEAASQGTRSRSQSARPSAAASKKSRPTYLGAASSSSESESEDGSDVSFGSDNTTDIDEFLVNDDDDDEARAIVDTFREGVRGRSQGMRFYFKTYLVYLIHTVVCPQVDWIDMKDTDFKEARNRVQEHLRGLLQSLIGSSAWKPKFQHAMDTRPDFVLDEIPAGERGGPCDACTMGGHRHSVFTATLGGRKYNAKTLRLMTVSDDSSDSSSDESSSSSSDDGKKSKDKYPKEKKYEFSLGKFCAGRADVYHQVKHWPYRTKERMLERLKPLRNPVPRKKLAPGASKEERRKAEKELVEWKANEAVRLVEEAEKRKIASNFANALDKELQDAINNFTGNK
ncbi:hypothetical protein JCM8547_008815 [Rhodosporidiobolus lusitaniae]